VVTFSDADRAFMRRALFVAERGRGRTSPNPIVGAVVVTRDGCVVGQGAHMRAGEPHAEVHALQQAGSLARGATLYCTLEPCAHSGRTPPCAPRVAAAGIARAVIAAGDPNPLVSGRGIGILRDHGIAVEVGLCEEQAVRQNAPFRTWMLDKRPHVTVKVARTADGFVGAPGPRVKLTGPAMDRLMHRQRAEVDALAIGSRTLAADDPLLTARGAYRERPLTRVIFDWSLRCGADRRVYGTRDAGPILVFATGNADAPARRAIEGAGGEVVTLRDRSLAAALGHLAGRGVTSLLVEGGPGLQDAFAAAKLVDRVQTIVVPMSLGDGVAEPRLLELEGRLSQPRVTRAGSDTLLEADVHRAD
jgi:diaminohydroxyphosphoribosylaminopyrimidine deaminase/5-amino-6-(5-phosphoribosylamino)uracil reductase